MTKLMMVFVLACTLQVVGVFAQKLELNELKPLPGWEKDLPADRFESERVTARDAPRQVCTKADAPRPGARTFGGPCAENARLRIPFDNSPAWDCEQAHGVGNCMLVEFNNPNFGTLGGLDTDTRQVYLYYVPKCKQGFRFYMLARGEWGNKNREQDWLYRARPKDQQENN